MKNGGYDLEAAITGWRSNLSAQESIGADAARELESHLREGVAEWISKGLTAKEAFGVAVGRLGKPERVAAEFAKEDLASPWRRVCFWMMICVIGLKVWRDLSHLFIDAPMAYLINLAGKPLTIESLRPLLVAQWAVYVIVPILLGMIISRDLLGTRRGLLFLFSSRQRMAAALLGVIIAGGVSKYAAQFLWWYEPLQSLLPAGSTLLRFSGLQVFVAILPSLFATFIAVMTAPGLGRAKIGGVE